MLTTTTATTAIWQMVIALSSRVEAAAERL